MTPEGKVKHDIKKVLAHHRVWYYMPVQNGMGRVGIPDFVCIVNGRFLGVEAKAEGKENTVTKNQAHVISGIRAAGGMAIVCSDARELDKFLTHIINANPPSHQKHSV